MTYYIFSRNIIIIHYEFWAFFRPALTILIGTIFVRIWKQYVLIRLSWCRIFYFHVSSLDGIILISVFKAGIRSTVLAAIPSYLTAPFRENLKMSLEQFPNRLYQVNKLS